MPRIVDHEHRRTEIVMALWQVIHENGIDGVTLRAVARAADISVGRLQHYFDSKAELVLHGCRQIVAAAVDDHGPAKVPPGPAAARHALVDLLCAPLPHDEGFRMGAAVWTSYLAKAASDPDIAEIVTEALARRVSTLAELLLAARTTATGQAANNNNNNHNDDDDDSSVEALRLASISEGFTQRVLTGAMTPDHARQLLRTEVDRCLTRQ